jgi:uncharacterized protein
VHRAIGTLGSVTTTNAARADGARSAAHDLADDRADDPADDRADDLDQRLARLSRRLAELPGVLVAFSGGADSAFLLAAAVRALGPRRVAAATAVSASLPESERLAAASFSADLGVRHVFPRTHEMEREGYRANAGDRCYFCKAELLDVLGPVAAELGLGAVATGTNADDARAGFRPGIRAAHERQAVTPLLDAGLSKADVRQASRDWGLVTWDKPAAACLSSRIAFGIEVTPFRLTRVDRAEKAVIDTLAPRVSIRDLRVRDLDTSVRVELDGGSLALVQAAGLDHLVADAIEAAGFPGVPVELRAFRSGSMNDLLPDPGRYR